ncbi:MAG TPA: O-antigen ligase family protein [Pseudolabrys sp.]|nr:O-antigen ligase family protein [Pseudolabrys sp.]
MGLLAVACIIAGVRFDRRVTVLMLILLMWNMGGLMSLINVVGREKTVQYAATSIYLAIAALMWACILAENTMPRMSALRSAYILSAVLAAVAGILGYFNIGGLEELFAPGGRAMGAFKDPNVYAPFLIWPALVLMQRMLVHRLRLVDLGAFGLIVVALLLAFSRGAWFHFALSGAIMIALSFLTARRASTRTRIFFMSAVAFAAMVAFVVFLLSIPAIHQMFEVRAQLIQPYDVGQGGRFRLQEIAITSVLKHMNGLGPFGFSTAHGSQQHNVYLQAFLVYGWLGGVTYILLVLATFWAALRTVFVTSPWQSYAIIALAVFTGEVAESFIIDSDHWRHFFLILGMVWGLWAATDRYRKQLHAALTAPGFVPAPAWQATWG